MNLFDSRSPLRFNHDSVGITNPCLHIALDEEQNEDIVSDCRSYTAAPNGGVDECWWPSSCGAGAEKMTSANHGQNGWRVIRYRRRIGIGQDCYDRVRDAALDWEFQAREYGQCTKFTMSSGQTLPSGNREGMASDNIDGEKESDGDSLHSGRSMGILRAPSTLSRSLHLAPRIRTEHQCKGGYDIISNVSYNDGGSDLYEPLAGTAKKNLLQIWSGPGGRRLVTYTEVKVGGGKIKLRLPSLFAVNPVMVVYDLVDQRGTKTTYTSTAYATLKGHLLSGEERVTVALRDDVGQGTFAIAGPSGSISVNGNKNGYVDVEILSYSRAAPSFLGKMVWPFIGKMQSRFFVRQLDFFEKVASTSSDGNSGRGSFSRNLSKCSHADVLESSLR